jgi:hypothetical protein
MSRIPKNSLNLTKTIHVSTFKLQQTNPKQASKGPKVIVENENEKRKNETNKIHTTKLQ